jgi:hypothetical protein
MATPQSRGTRAPSRVEAYSTTADADPVKTPALARRNRQLDMKRPTRPKLRRANIPPWRRHVGGELDLIEMSGHRVGNVHHQADPDFLNLRERKHGSPQLRIGDGRVIGRGNRLVRILSLPCSVDRAASNAAPVQLAMLAGAPLGWVSE